MKRKVGDVDDDDNGGVAAHKKQKLSSISTTSNDESPPQANQLADKTPSAIRTKKEKQPSRRIRKLVPPRPWSFNPTADNATGPRSAKEGRNYICLTRRTKLGCYMRRCKALFLDDGYTSIHLSAMGAAIPHLMQLACTLPDILPFPRNEIRMEVMTGTVEVQDEVLPENIDEDMVYDTRCKSTLKITLTVEKVEGLMKKRRGSSKGRVRIVEEPEQDLPDMV